MDFFNIFQFSILFILLTFLLPFNDGRKCFSCTTADNPKCLHLDKNETRLIDRKMVVDCKEFCTIRRQEYADDRGGVAWLNRSCESDFMDLVLVDGYFILRLRSCKQNLCNSGDGMYSFGEIIEDLDNDSEMGNYTLYDSSSQRIFPMNLFTITWILQFLLNLLIGVLCLSE